MLRHLKHLEITTFPFLDKKEKIFECKCFSSSRSKHLSLEGLLYKRIGAILQPGSVRKKKIMIVVKSIHSLPSEFRNI